ncbi:uncharacterized protein LOC132340564 [Haemorhous mexicanus]|uniref:uncharacterized protein LOC132340564 n=1 Tax=Haemorhous mexicanus TaxID=30427 RepID=UPI0028BD18B4|nr:uncharacterized protein LOC132340564 [Haemorhous mexicanus]
METDRPESGETPAPMGGSLSPPLSRYKALPPAAPPGAVPWAVPAIHPLPSPGTRLCPRLLLLGRGRRHPCLPRLAFLLLPWLGPRLSCASPAPRSWRQRRGGGGGGGDTPWPGPDRPHPQDGSNSILRYALPFPLLPSSADMLTPQRASHTPAHLSALSIYPRVYGKSNLILISYPNYHTRASSDCPLVHTAATSFLSLLSLHLKKKAPHPTEGFPRFSVLISGDCLSGYYHYSTRSRICTPISNSYEDKLKEPRRERKSKIPIAALRSGGAGTIPCATAAGPTPSPAPQSSPALTAPALPDTGAHRAPHPCAPEHKTPLPTALT